MRDHQRPVAALKDLLEHDDLADRLVALGDDDVERLVEHDLLAGLELADVDPRAHAHPHLPAAGEHVRGTVLSGLKEDPEAGRRLGQPVDFLLERHDLVARLTQGPREPLVLSVDAGQARLGLPKPLFEQPGLPWRVRKPAAQSGDLLLEEGDLRGKDLDLVVISSGARAVVARGHAPHPLPRADLPLTLPIREASVTYGRPQLGFLSLRSGNSRASSVLP